MHTINVTLEESDVLHNLLRSKLISVRAHRLSDFREQEHMERLLEGLQKKFPQKKVHVVGSGVS